MFSRGDMSVHPEKKSDVSIFTPVLIKALYNRELYDAE